MTGPQLQAQFDEETARAVVARLRRRHDLDRLTARLAAMAITAALGGMVATALCAALVGAPA